ncbi:MAG: ATP-binding cassette domain-containing protein [Cytophagales bacterium]|nr:ATP-binding cassette domain-containing protein [Cytophagales bacterium]
MQAFPFLSLQNATLRRSGGTVLTNVDWTVEYSQQWAVVGPTGSGKTTLLEAVAGKIPLGGGSLRYGFFEREKQDGPPPVAASPWAALAYVPAGTAFTRLSNTPDRYYQQRFHSMDSDDFPTTREFLLGSNGVGEEPAPEGQARQLDRLAGLLRIAPLLDREVVKLSNGETKRVLITKALLQAPRLLLLDNPFTGLDAAARQLLRDCLADLVGTGIHVILATVPGEIPPGITHVLSLMDGRAEPFTRKAFDEVTSDAALVRVDAAPLLPALPHSGEAPSFRVAVRMNGVNVQYGGVRILEDVHWTVVMGEKWALLGPNGSGKSTLLSLINGDNPQAYANDIVLFDRKKGSGESVWEIKRKIGYVSPELHAYYPKSATCFEAMASGFGDTLHLQGKLSLPQAETVGTYLHALGLEALRDAPLWRLSAGEVRLALVARALVKAPPLLILDEPCQGLDESYQRRIRTLLESTCRHPGQTMIYVTHYPTEIPNCVTQVLRLEAGRVAGVGSC